MCNYTGNGGLEAFKVVPKGAGFEIEDYHDFLKPMQATDAEFGYDGKLYVSDFVGLDWSGKSRAGGSTPSFDPEKNERARQCRRRKAVRRGVRANWTTGFDSAKICSGTRTSGCGCGAQYELENVADRGSRARRSTRNCRTRRASQLARIHAIWGLGQIRRQDRRLDAEFRTAVYGRRRRSPAQAVESAGRPRGARSRRKGFGESPADSTSPRVRFFAAQSLGKLKHKPAIAGPVRRAGREQGRRPVAAARLRRGPGPHRRRGRGERPGRRPQRVRPARGRAGAAAAR